MRKLNRCGECGELPRMKPKHHPLGRGKTEMVVIPQHTPSCSRGRCGATHNPGKWPYTSRCITRGKENHGNHHRDVHGQTWSGEFMTLDEELEFRNDAG